MLQVTVKDEHGNLEGEVINEGEFMFSCIYYKFSSFLSCIPYYYDIMTILLQVHMLKSLSLLPWNQRRSHQTLHAVSAPCVGSP